MTDEFPPAHGSVPVPRRGGVSRLVGHAPAWVGIVVGLALIVLGVFIVSRPLTSLWVLAIYIGISAIASGVMDLIAPRDVPRRANIVLAVLWIIGGGVILFWLGRNLDLLPELIAGLLVLGGLGAAIGVFRGRVSERVLAGASGLAQVVFGLLALLWPDVTLLVVAIAFGLRTVVLGAVLTWRASRRIRGRSPRPGETSGNRRGLVWAAAGRYALAAVLLGLAGGSWWVSTWLADGAPVVDAFYDAPDGPPSAPGTLLREGAYSGRTPVGGEVRRILYSTTDTFGSRALASGLVISPADMPPGPRPVIIWNHGTTGVARGCAPSLADASATRWAIPAIDRALAAGWVVVATDYTGQGAPGTFPYLIGESEARSAIDAVRAAEDADGMWLSPEVVVWGHSQGGHAALWVSAVAPNYAPELSVLGTVAISPAADPLALAEELARTQDSAMLSVLISWVLVPYADTYPDVTISDYVAPGGRSIVREMTQRCPTEPGVVVSVLAALGVSADRPLYDADLTAGALGERLAQNAAIGPWTAPVLLAWGGQDEVIPTSLYERFVGERCAGGQALQVRVYDVLDHTGPMLPGSPFLSTLMRWTEARFDGVPVTAAANDCRA
ncbi:conserved membrane hypothetical protein [Microbacterium sp. C448]|uniref:lipase family protein n=1 Tax=Microbacterium sp. C448 TaxID=1177594 RepID=UPI0003DE1573|nr:lipase family protein [Microbacterium sp. C448]CDK01387.1 conserved membrane hypothetical protein [Microbacterium sp. C448]